ncbi:type VI secretion protein VasK [Burkholderia sp. WAC0059]|uniref:ImcF-related family protein n=1 Tax=Burkholderia sp. WAC0059 TaxID=2066022 RepID=UPI000C7EDBC6|nr:ImcF-related family protein [Burkholderia sp. WAC0059]PLZ04030.1 type VI secretion protein VasK [Burkholderia sp. WAC0059]
MNEHKPQPVAIFIGIAIAIVFLALGIAVWIGGPGRGWSRDTRIIIELSLLSGLLVALILVKYFEAVVLWIASMRAAKWLAQYDSKRQAHGGAGQATSLQETDLGQPDALRNALRERHGWRWRYRDRWVAVAGDEPIVRRLAPGLVRSGYMISGDTILLYAKQTGDQLDTAWLDRIRRLRRRRPVDAVVAVVRTHTSGNRPFDAERTAQRLACHSRALRWAAPMYLLNVTEAGSKAIDQDEAIGCTWSNARLGQGEVITSLGGVSDALADAGVVRLTKDAADRYFAELSNHIAQYGSALSDLVTQIGRSRIWRGAIHGVLFTPLFKARDAEVPEAGAGEGETIAQLTVWQTIADHSRRIHGRRVGFSLSSTAAWAVTACVAFWIAGTFLSGFANRATIQTAANTADDLSTAQDRTQAALILVSLQKQLDTLEVHQHDGAPWTTRFGLNRDAELFATLWPAYESGVVRIIIDPIREKLEQHLRQLASLSDAEIASGGDTQVNSAYDTLKTYLMLAKPERANPAFLAPQLIATAAPARPLNSSLSEGAWQDLRQHLIAFYANHLGQRMGTSGSSLAIIPDASLVNATRQTVIGVRDIRNSTDEIYQQMLDEAMPKYPPVSLAALLGDTSSRGLFGTTATVPGVFTRAAWDERISKAIDEASEQRNVAGDWVLSDAPTTSGSPRGKEVPLGETRTDATLAASLKAELRQRYFDDYARAWQLFLNSIRWQPTPTLSGTVDQLTLLGDPQRSPLVALMNVAVYQAGAGATTQSLSDTLISKAQHLVGADESPSGTSFPRGLPLVVGAKDPSTIAPSRNIAPLASAFGPLLRLTGSDLGAGSGKAAAQIAATGDLSLARFLERVTAMRLKLQQIMMGNDPDAMSRAAAQAVLQGKTSDIADSRDYASRVAASLGEQWAGFGQLLEQPLDQTWQVVLQPASSSLNDTWRTAIVADWDKTFGGRYPFADSDNDASLPEMARFMRPDNGVIAQFVTSQLAGIVERQGDRWVPAQGANPNTLTVDPAFLAALNKLMRVSTVLFPSGDAHIRYELRPVPTPGVTDMKFVLSGRELHYFNQKEEWTPFVWPGDALEDITRIEWQTGQGGLRSSLDAQGRFGLIRLLEHATVTPQDSARYLLSWNPDPSLGIPLRVQLRSEAGAGPLDVLALRHFTLPTRIFVTGPSPAARKQASPKGTFFSRGLPLVVGASANPPPLSPAAIDAAKHAVMPLPHGTLPEVE